MIHSINDAKTNEYISLVRNHLGGEERFVQVITFGCQQNERDSETILGLCKEMGYTQTEDSEKADIVIVNTCAFLQSAREEAIETLLECADYNCDGFIDALDASAVLAEYALSSIGSDATFTKKQRIFADVNLDGTVNSSDASLILEWYAKESTGG